MTLPLAPLGIASNKPRAAKRCAECHKPIENPTWNQVVHQGKCEIARSRKIERKRKAAAANKKMRRRIGAIKGTKPERDSDYKNWIRTLPCLICFRSFWKHFFARGCTFSEMIVLITLTRSRQGSPTESAHTGPHALGSKSSDRSLLPLCGDEHHREGKRSYHKLGEKAFEKTHGIKIARIAAALNTLYESQKEAAA